MSAVGSFGSPQLQPCRLSYPTPSSSRCYSWTCSRPGASSLRPFQVTLTRGCCALSVVDADKRGKDIARLGCSAVDRGLELIPSRPFFSPGLPFVSRPWSLLDAALGEMSSVLGVLELHRPLLVARVLMGEGGGALAGCYGLALSGGGSCSWCSTSSLLTWGVGRLPVRLSFLIVGLSCASADEVMSQSLSWICCWLLFLLLPSAEDGELLPHFLPTCSVEGVAALGRWLSPGSAKAVAGSCVVSP